MKAVEARRTQKILPTYLPKEPNALPMFFEKKPYQGATGRLYPLPFSDGITDEKKDVAYDLFTLENEYIHTEILPALGGKILRGWDKIGQYDFIYYNEVVKPALVGLAGAWISGGIEFNWPQHHRPTTFLPLEAALEENPDGSKTVWVGEVDPLYHMKGMAGITLDPGRSYIRAKIRLYNRTPFAQGFMWWANLAVPVNKDYRTIFPPDVEWVNDHDRRAVISWPVAKGVYRTARPFDYGEGTDLSRYDSVKVPSSFLVSEGQSALDFVAGYDEGLGKGIVTVANHHIAPGKKMWTWGHGEFGDMWCSNLTDENGPYIELMTGVYTDNQPDFSWIAPYESREFEQFWYPIRDLGDVKNATVDAAVNVERRDGELFFGFNVTGQFDGCRISVRDGEREIFGDTADLRPERAYLRTIPLEGRSVEAISVCLSSADGRTLVSHKPCARGQKRPIEVRRPAPRPAEIENNEELYIHAAHLEQYKQHNYDPRDYYREALKRDPGDIRCNTGMARLALKDGKFAECARFCDKALERLTSRNQHPSDTEALYLKGLALGWLENYEEACDALNRAAWSYAYRGAAHYRLAQIDCRFGRWEAALEKLEISIKLNEDHRLAANLRCAALRQMGRMEEAAEESAANAKRDPLDLWARLEQSAISGDLSQIAKIFGGKGENFLDVAGDYLEAGLFEDALRALEAAPDTPMVGYYRAYCLRRLNREPIDARTAPASVDLCFPSRLADIAVLESAIAADAADANARYLLGCLFYDRFRYDEAAALWEQAISIDPGHAPALRNLSLAYFDKRGDAAGARICMERALQNSGDPRLLFEYQQLLKNSDVSPDERLRVYERYPDMLAARDDCYLDRIVLLCMRGEYKAAIDAARARRFHIYEGGEGKLTKQHAWMHVLYGNALAAEGRTEEAARAYSDGANMPKSYGEAKTFFNQEAHIYYYLGRLLESRGQGEAARKAFAEASVYKAAISEISLFRALALRKLNEFGEAARVLEEMLSTADELLRNRDLRAYYGVGSPTPMPFEYDIEKQNGVEAHILRAYALLGLGRREDANAAIAAAERLDPHNFRIYAYRQILPTL